MTQDIYSLTVWTWDAEAQEYEPLSYDQRSEEDAKAAFRAAEVTNDTPQIDLVLRHINRYGCTESKELLARKD